MKAMTTTSTKSALNPYSWNVPFTFTDTDEWITALCKATDEGVKDHDGARNMHFHLPQYRNQHPRLDLKQLDWYAFKVYAEPGANEGHYIRMEAYHRSTGVVIGLISCKTFSGLDNALAVAAFLTRAVFGREK